MLVRLTVPSIVMLAAAPLSMLRVSKFVRPVTLPESTLPPPDWNSTLSVPPPPSRAAPRAAPPAKISVSSRSPNATDPAITAPVPTVTLTSPPVCLIAALPGGPGDGAAFKRDPGFRDVARRGTDRRVIGAAAAGDRPGDGDRDGVGARTLHLDSEIRPRHGGGVDRHRGAARGVGHAGSRHGRNLRWRPRR